MDLFVNDASMDVEDEIIEEIPVYLNNRFGSNLMLLQYPTRAEQTSSSVPFTPMETEKIVLKKESEVLEVDLNAGVPPHLINSSSNETHNGLKQKFSGPIAKNDCRYAVGVMHNNELHLNLVPQTVQLRPKFERVEENTLHQHVTDAPNLKSVQMSVKSTSQDAQKHSTVLDYWRKVNKEDGEEFVPTEGDLEMLVLDAKDGVVKCDNVSEMSFLK